MDENDQDTKEPDKPMASKMIIEAEKRAVGRPKLSLFTTYFRYCGGGWFGVAWVLLSTTWQGLTVAQSFTLKVGDLGCLVRGQGLGLTSSGLFGMALVLLESSCKIYLI